MNLIKKDKEILKETQSENKFKCDILKDSVESFHQQNRLCKRQSIVSSSHDIQGNDKFKNILLNGTHRNNKIP